MQIRLSLLIIAGLTASGKAAADNWVAFGASADGTIYSVDVDSVRKDGDRIVIWEEKDHSHDKTVSERMTMNLVSIDCKSRTSEFLHTTTYDRSGRVLRSEDYSADVRKPIYSPPGSIGDTLIRAVCR